VGEVEDAVKKSEGKWSSMRLRKKGSSYMRHIVIKKNSNKNYWSISIQNVAHKVS
jgi:hypothetical protein